MSPAPDTRTHSCHLKAAGGGAEETANLPCLDPVSPPPPQDLPSSQSSAGLARELQEGGVAPGTVAGIRGGLEGGPAAHRAAICSWAPSTAGCREERELAAPPARAEPRPLRAPTVGLPTGSGEAGRAVLAASDFLSEKYTEQRAHSCAPSAQK